MEFAESARAFERKDRQRNINYWYTTMETRKENKLLDRPVWNEETGNGVASFIQRCQSQTEIAKPRNDMRQRKWLWSQIKEQHLHVHNRRTTSHFWEPGSPSALNRIPLTHLSWAFFHVEGYGTPSTYKNIKHAGTLPGIHPPPHTPELSWNSKHKKDLIFSHVYGPKNSKYLMIAGVTTWGWHFISLMLKIIL